MMKHLPNYSFCVLSSSLMMMMTMMMMIQITSLGRYLVDKHMVPDTNFDFFLSGIKLADSLGFARNGRRYKNTKKQGTQGAARCWLGGFSGHALHSDIIWNANQDAGSSPPPGCLSFKPRDLYKNPRTLRLRPGRRFASQVT